MRSATARICALFIAAWTWPPIEAAAAAPPLLADAPHVAEVIVVRRGWHIDVGFTRDALDPALRSVAAELPDARYVLFGFGDMRYLMSKHHNASTLAAALWPGRGIMLVTGLEGTAQQAFGPNSVVAVPVSAAQSAALQRAIWQSFDSLAGRASVYAPGPYQGSLYFLATPRYSALRTCNTWAAQTLRAGGLPIHSGTVLFAGQLWRQVLRLGGAPRARPAPAVTPPDTPH